MHRAVLPSGWNALGLVRHLALDVEQFSTSSRTFGTVQARSRRLRVRSSDATVSDVESRCALGEDSITRWRSMRVVFAWYSC